jgi:hypothetical protein
MQLLALFRYSYTYDIIFCNIIFKIKRKMHSFKSATPTPYPNTDFWVRPSSVPPLSYLSSWRDDYENTDTC